MNIIARIKSYCALRNSSSAVGKYFKNIWTLEWKDQISLTKRLLITLILLSPFLLFIIYIIWE